MAEDTLTSPPSTTTHNVSATITNLTVTPASEVSVTVGGMTTSTEVLDRRDFPQAERDAMDSEDFGGPHESFPIKSQEDVHNAAKLIGHADDPDAVKAKIKRIAKRKGFSLPKSWEDDTASEGKDRAAQPGDHPPFSGAHTHKHLTFSAGDDGDMHAHDHEHDDDSNHKHSHANMSKQETPPEKERAVAYTPDRFSVYLPITRVDGTSRMVTGQATVEKPDAYGTIFGYYPEAWLKWRGNMREQHDPKKAVGKAIEVVPDEQERAIYVTSKVSRGAQDTWLKIEDGVLTGYSASIIPDPEFGNDPRKWPKKEYNGKDYPYLPRYTVAETSYVDNPATPGCNISLIRADGFLTEIVDVSEPDQPVSQERAGARVSGSTKSKMHESIGHTLHAAVSQMKNCNCPACEETMRVIDPDGDGDIDLGGYDDPDHSSDAPKPSATEDMERVVTGLIERSLQPVYLRLQSIAGTLAKTPSSVPQTHQDIDALFSGALTRALETLDAKFALLATQASFDEVRAELSAVKGQVDKIAEQPLPGGPVANAGSLPHPAEKTLPTDAPVAYGRQSYGSVYDAIAHLSKHGQLDTQDKQVDAMTAGLIAQRQARR